MDPASIATYNPFTVNGSRKIGMNWTLPDITPFLASIPTAVINGPGYGCFSDPLVPQGFPLDFTSNGTLSATVNNACKPGFFCPYLDISDNRTWPVMCPPSGDCFFYRSYGTPCWNPQGIFEPMACPSGFYCPDHKTILPCPEGFYCVAGTTTPIKCEFMSICSVGTIVQAHYGLLLIALAIDAILFVGYFTLRMREYKRANPHRSLLGKKMPTLDAAGQPELKYLKSNMALDATEIQRNISALTDGFHKGLNGRDDLQMNYEFEGLSLTLPDGKNILQGVSGSINAGKMTAIMGPSGAGKTTFMNVLMGKVARTSGTLKINNSVAEMSTFRKLIGYVPQDDVMIEELSVRENICYAARTRLPDSWTNKEVDSHVDAVLKALNLSGVAHKRIGNVLERGISGGQRKRVNIGMELAAAPLSVFLDEPTSGLDSTSAMDSVNILSSISRLGLTIVAVVHQPRVEIFESFDDVLMIAPGGRTSYFGPVSGAKPYFESLGFEFPASTNVADTLMDILAGRGQLRSGIPLTRLTASSLVDEWNNRNHSVETTQPSKSAETSIDSMKQIANLRGASFLRQVGLSHNRSLTQQSRLATALMLEIFVGLVAGAIMGVAGGGELNAHYIAPYTPLSPATKTWYTSMYGMLIGISISLSSAPAGVKVFSEEKAVYKRESEAGHNSVAYFIGKNVSVIYRILLAAAHFTSLYYFLSQPPIAVGMQFSLLFLNFFGIYGLGMAISMLVRRENAPLIAVTTGLISEVLCGFGPDLNSATADGYVFILDIGINRWMAEAQYWLWAQPYLNIFDVTLLTDAYGYVQGNTTRNLIAMLGLGLAYRVLAFVFFLCILNAGYFRGKWAGLKAKKGKGNVTSA
ncbi:hypothetical protein HDU98_011427 [Podochytrium sp. JEL0797]|nr:hypothetical protein HDU98_011427 [Podochytrium sp. JEL0797]